MLHIVNSSHTQTSALASCLRLAQPGATLLLIEDAIYAATTGAGMADAMKGFKVCVLQPDVEARGMAGRLIDGLSAVDYAGFVDLVVEHPNSQTWL
ncbi:MAG: sulfurtransferase complex subunit TusB [Rubrivivax sp.]|nr:sulfurtransferase complex subunit TusB [Rubrivivax sp.]MBK7264093.1 sulfurtransferase complex subunit TusB [Rubrivivax sp.]MBK8525726.1 sulfurtransferase complex subunit TusB [Rubrivivax sp.]